MKKPIVFLSIVCVLSFIAFGISCVILGIRDSGSATSHITVEQGQGSGGERNIFSELVSSDNDWEIVNEFRNININAAGAETIIQQNNGDRILVSAQVPDGRELYVGAKYSESASKLTIEVRPRNITFDFVEEFGKVIWTDDVFKFPEGVKVTISFPQSIYEGLQIKLGSGKMYIDELYAMSTNVYIGSGTFEMQRSEDFVGDTFTLDLGSGNAKVKNMRASRFATIDVGSGKFYVTGIDYSGRVNMGSGSGTIVLGKECKDFDVDVGSGKLGLYLEETGAIVDTDISSGSVNIDAYGVKVKLTNDDKDDNDVVTVGNGSADLEIEMGSGSIDILEAANAPALELNIPKSVLTGPAASKSEVSSTFSAYSSEPTVTQTGDMSVITSVVIETPPPVEAADSSAAA